MRAQLTKAVYFDSPGPGRLRAGTWVITTPAERQSPTDVYWPNAPSNLPTSSVSTITGVDSVGG